MSASLDRSGAVDFVAELVAANVSIATAESLTGGMVAATLAEVPGVSAALRGGAVVYQNDVKASVLNVSPTLLADKGSVDPDVAVEMAAGAARLFGARMALATTGAAGPEPHDGKPVGTVYIAVSLDARTTVKGYLFEGDRKSIREQACTSALALAREALVRMQG